MATRHFLARRDQARTATHRSSGRHLWQYYRSHWCRVPPSATARGALLLLPGGKSLMTCMLPSTLREGYNIVSSEESRQEGEDYVWIILSAPFNPYLCRRSSSCVACRCPT